MSTTRVRRRSQNIFGMKKRIANRIPKITYIVIFASMAFSVLLFSQQSQREHIYLDGRIVAVESRSFSPPAVAITSPTSGSSYGANGSSMTLSGTASSGVTSVSWSNSSGGSGNCSGTTSWSCNITGLQNRPNILTVTARNGENGLATDSLTVYYCTYSIAPASATMAAGAGSGSVALTASNSVCGWTAAVTSTANPQWLTITSGASGSGNGTVNYSVTANSGASRTGVLTIGNQTFTVRQVSAACSSQCTAAAAACAASGGVCVDQCIASTCPMNPSVCGAYCQAMCAGQGGGTDCNAVYDQCLEGCD